MNHNKQRDSNFELLRICAMLMIIGSHLAAHGIQHQLDADANLLFGGGYFINKIFVSMLSMGGRIGVALFFFLTGYFMLYDDKCSGLLRIILEVLYYGIISIFVLALSYFFGWHFPELGMTQILYYAARYCFNPISSGVWWFASAYILLVAVHSTINKAISKLNIRGFTFLIIFVWLFEYSIAGFLDGGYYNLQKAFFFYLIGAYIRKYEVLQFFKSRIRKLTSVGILILIISTHTVVAYFYYMKKQDSLSAFEKLGNKMVLAFDSDVLVVIAAIIVFCLFGSLKMKYNAQVNRIASTTFGIYLIHDSVFGRSWIWRGLLKVDTVAYACDAFPLIAIADICIVFCVCSFLDMLRIRYIDKKMLSAYFSISDKVHEKYFLK